MWWHLIRNIVKSFLKFFKVLEMSALLLFWINMQVSLEHIHTCSKNSKKIQVFIKNCN